MALNLIPPKLQFFITPANQCNYLPDQESTTLFADPDAPMFVKTYSALALYGFRRSGENVYLPQCEHCQACVPLRVPVDTFRMSRSQKRVWSKNRDLDVTQVEPGFNEAHFQLYKRYIAGRHSSGEMDYDDPDQYMSFLTSSWSDTAFYEIRLEDKLIGVSVVDVLPVGLSAVYTFYDPDFHSRSIGVYSVLWEIEETRRRHLPWLFLGYWIKDCKKMNYKTQYQPYELLRKGIWEVVDV